MLISALVMVAETRGVLEVARQCPGEFLGPRGQENPPSPRPVSFYARADRSASPGISEGAGASAPARALAGPYFDSVRTSVPVMMAWASMVSFLPFCSTT